MLEDSFPSKLTVLQGRIVLHKCDLTVKSLDYVNWSQGCWNSVDYIHDRLILLYISLGNSQWTLSGHKSFHEPQYYVTWIYEWHSAREIPDEISSHFYPGWKGYRLSLFEWVDGAHLTVANTRDHLIGTCQACYASRVTGGR